MNNEEKILQMLTNLTEDVSQMKEDIEIIKEDVEITRGATNTLVDWAERIEDVTKIPLVHHE